jgi:hypothetical protein
MKSFISFEIIFNMTDEKTKRMKDEILVVLKLKFFVTVNEGSNKLLLR